MRHRALQIVMLLALAISANFAHAENAAARDAKIEALIAQLVSPNQTPQTKGPDAKYPAGYDHKAQERVRAAWKQLYDLGPVAFPQLIKHFDDDRYSFTADGGAADRNWPVGGACSDIVRCYLQPYSEFALTVDEGKGKRRRRRPNYFYDLRLNDRETAERWWKKHRDKSLREIQIESLEWVLAEEVKRPNVYDIEERRHIESILTKLEASDKPLPPSWPFSK
jgi:hypothetical protein